ncbi:hypothetical protein [Arthrobacter sp. B2a2-09]|nr:hypothetical protein [Arthrobacter sp. B2a2-09]
MAPIWKASSGKHGVPRAEAIVFHMIELGPKYRKYREENPK